ncbi:MAG: hypothetical protein CPDRYMAC_1945 [uncultured Paraburkholderia sp.]|nr:MAG: hypothetical protein CPDRYDRY_1833 [uncultured Paraburkholderia sp.]CAH2921730.1 MAG: hypothetical protein CPDRYMAC_1945 [uncultured Paraburkholderia sp.]
MQRDHDLAVLTHMAAGENLPGNEFRVLQVRLDKGDSHLSRSAGMSRTRLFRKAFSLPNITPTPKLNR